MSFAKKLANRELLDVYGETSGNTRMTFRPRLSYGFEREIKNVYNVRIKGKEYMNCFPKILRNQVL